MFQLFTCSLSFPLFPCHAILANLAGMVTTPFEIAGDENIVMLDDSLPLPVSFMSVELICLLSGYRTVEPAPFQLTSLAGCPDTEEFSRFLIFIRDILLSGEVRIDSGFFPTE